jgi:hypothetical protein
VLGEQRVEERHITREKLQLSVYLETDKSVGEHFLRDMYMLTDGWMMIVSSYSKESFRDERGLERKHKKMSCNSDVVGVFIFVRSQTLFWLRFLIS